MSKSQHTPGPWHWEANPKSREIHLESGTGMGEIVMDFVRWGMSAAMPRFRSEDGHTLERVESFFRIEDGREHHAAWHRLVDHPDARLIAAAPDLLEAAKGSLYWLEAHFDDTNCDWDFAPQRTALRAAIAKAKPEGRES